MAEYIDREAVKEIMQKYRKLFCILWKMIIVKVPNETIKVMIPVKQIAHLLDN